MGYEFADQAEETLHVWQFRMGTEGRLIRPLGMSEKHEWIARRFVEMNTNTASLGARRLQNEQKFVKQLTLFSRSGLKANENVKRHDGPRFR